MLYFLDYSCSDSLTGTTLTGRYTQIDCRNKNTAPTVDTIWNNHEPRNNLPWVQLKRLGGDHFQDIFLCIPTGKLLGDIFSRLVK